MRKGLAVLGLMGAAVLFAGCGPSSLFAPAPTEQVDFTYAIDELFVSVVAHISLPGAHEIEITWYWGDGASSTGTGAQHAYAEPGLYEITMRVVARFPYTEDGAPPGRAYLKEREYVVKKSVLLKRHYDLVLQGEPMPPQWPRLPEGHFYAGQLISFFLVTEEEVGHVVWYFWRITEHGPVLVESVSGGKVVTRSFIASSCRGRACYTYAVTCAVTNAAGTSAATLRKEFKVCPPP